MPTPKRECPSDMTVGLPSVRNLISAGQTINDLVLFTIYPILRFFQTRYGPKFTDRFGRLGHSSIEEFIVMGHISLGGKGSC